MFKPTKATTIKEYIRALEPERRRVIEWLHRFIQSKAKRLEPRFAYNMIGYGSYTYLSYKNKVSTWPVVALASQKRHFSVYVCVPDDGRYLPEKYRDDLGKVSIGKSCIRFRKLEDLNTKTLAKMLKEAEKASGSITDKARAKLDTLAKAKAMTMEKTRKTLAKTRAVAKKASFSNGAVAKKQTSSSNKGKPAAKPSDKSAAKARSAKNAPSTKTKASPARGASGVKKKKLVARPNRKPTAKARSDRKAPPSKTQKSPAKSGAGAKAKKLGAKSGRNAVGRASR